MSTEDLAESYMKKMAAAEIDPKTRKLLELVEAARTDEAKRRKLLRAPLESLAKLGASVGPTHQASVSQGLQALAFAMAKPEDGRLAAHGARRLGTQENFESTSISPANGGDSSYEWTTRR